MYGRILLVMSTVLLSTLPSPASDETRQGPMLTGVVLTGEGKAIEGATVLGYPEHVTRVKSACSTIPGLTLPRWSDHAEVTKLRACCQAVISRQALGNIAAELDRTLEPLRRAARSHNAHHVCRQLIAAIEARGIRPEFCGKRKTA